ncbi:hypothetical protein GCM10023107_35510 [Actinoplanes octamycinicus]
MTGCGLMAAAKVTPLRIRKLTAAPPHEAKQPSAMPSGTRCFPHQGYGSRVRPAGVAVRYQIRTVLGIRSRPQISRFLPV